MRRAASRGRNRWGQSFQGWGPRRQPRSELRARAFGYKATHLATAIDMLADYVHKDNSIQGLSLKRIDAIF